LRYRKRSTGRSIRTWRAASAAWPTCTAPRGSTRRRSRCTNARWRFGKPRSARSTRKSPRASSLAELYRLTGTAAAEARVAGDRKDARAERCGGGNDTRRLGRGASGTRQVRGGGGAL
jgi:hypothetical protein